MSKEKGKKSIVKKHLNKKLKKKILAFFGISNAMIIIVGLFTFSLVAIIIANEMNKENVEMGDIGALGVPAEYVEYFNEASKIFHVPNWVLAAVAKQESGFNPNTEYGGAYGIMQIQKYDSSTGKDLWNYLINLGLGNVYKEIGYKFSNS